MPPLTSKPSCEDVLDAFAVEPDSGRATLTRYLRDYPEFAAELVDLSRDLSREAVEDEELLSAEDTTLIERAWQKHLEAAPTLGADPFAALSVAELRELARLLDVPRQIITAIRERKVVVASIPQRFMERLATAMNSTAECITASLEQQSGPDLARSYKAATKPAVAAPIPFEQLLIDAGVSSAKLVTLMSEDP